MNEKNKIKEVEKVKIKRKNIAKNSAECKLCLSYEKM